MYINNQYDMVEGSRITEKMSQKTLTRHLRKNEHHNLDHPLTHQPFLDSSSTAKVPPVAPLSSLSSDNEAFHNLCFSKKFKYSSRKNSKNHSHSISINGNNKRLHYSVTPKKCLARTLGKSDGVLNPGEKGFNPFLSYSEIENKYGIKKKYSSSSYLHKQNMLGKKKRNPSKPKEEPGEQLNSTAKKEFRSSISKLKGKSFKKQKTCDESKASTIVNMIKNSRSKSKEVVSKKEMLINTILDKISRDPKANDNIVELENFNTNEPEKDSAEKDLFSMMKIKIAMDNSNGVDFDKKIILLFDELMKENSRLSKQLKKQYSYRDRILSSFNLLKTRWKEDRETRTNFMIVKQENAKLKKSLEIEKEKSKNFEEKINILENNYESLVEGNDRLKEELELTQSKLSELIQEFKMDEESDRDRITEVDIEQELDSLDEEQEEEKGSPPELHSSDSIAMENFENDVLKAYITSQKEEFGIKESEYLSEIVSPTKCYYFP